MVKWLMLVVLLLTPFGAFAAESNRMVTPRDTVSLVSQSDAATGKTVKLGLLFRLAMGWHIYWKNPGDAGVPPGVTFIAPKNAVAGTFAWPAPQWFVVNSIGDYVETGTVLLPFTVTLPHKVPAKGADFSAAAHWLVCSRKICVPEQAKFTLHETFGPAAPSAQSALFAAAAAAAPRNSPFTSKIAANSTLIVTGAGLGRQNVKSAHFFPDSAAVIANAAPQHLGFIKNGFLLRLKPTGWKPGAPLSGVLEITDRTGQMQALTISASPARTVPAAVTPRAAIIWPLFAAFLGGLILNLMPCVFPVLAMKALAMARLGTADRNAARIQALAYTAGAIVAMLAIGIVLLVLRESGGSFAPSFGWGFQFQSPVFVAIMAWLIFVVGLNFAGLFEIGSRFAGIGSGLAGRGGSSGSFATGLLAVVVATPCTAPFMGGAIAAALSAPPATALGIFAALGIGMALPFLVIGFVPGLGRLLPKPGGWMIILRQFMAFPMFATAVWLLWVMVQEAGADGALVVAGGAVLIALALWLLRFHGLVPRSLAVLAAVAAIALLPRIKPAQAASRISVPGAVPFSASKLAALRAQGRPVFIDMSAAWCVTCLVNERVALDPQAVQRDFQAHHVVLMVGDWTNRNPAITRYLAAHGRVGVPLYIYYPPDHRKPVMLPQILTPGIVEQALAGR